MCTCVCTYVCISAVYIRTYVCRSVYICLYVGMCTYVHVSSVLWCGHDMCDLFMACGMHVTCMGVFGGGGEGGHSPPYTYLAPPLDVCDMHVRMYVCDWCLSTCDRTS